MATEFRFVDSCGIDDLTENYGGYYCYMLKVALSAVSEDYEGDEFTLMAYLSEADNTPEGIAHNAQLDIDSFVILEEAILRDDDEFEPINHLSELFSGYADQFADDENFVEEVGC